jgi:hypothetical protein
MLRFLLKKAAEIQEIPVEGRDITRVSFAITATGFPESPNVSINGASSILSYLIDGLDNNERFLETNIPSGFVKDVTVLTNNFQLNMV